MFANICKFLRHLRHDYSIFEIDRSAVILANCKYIMMLSSRSAHNDGSSDNQQGTPENTSEETTDSTFTYSEDNSDESFTSKTDAFEEEIRLSDLKVKALSFLPTVDETALDPQQLKIHKAHVKALKDGEMLYKDPATGYQVMSRLAHLNRGDCCGNACRHCPFGQKSAPEELKKMYNSAFYE